MGNIDSFPGQTIEKEEESGCSDSCQRTEAASLCNMLIGVAAAQWLGRHAPLHGDYSAAQIDFMWRGEPSWVGPRPAKFDAAAHSVYDGIPEVSHWQSKVQGNFRPDAG
jgi:hypothetical protein